MSDNVDFLLCISRFLAQSNGMGLVCTYIVTSTISTKPQPWDTIITTELDQNSALLPNFGGLINQNDISVYHMPPLASKNNMTAYSAAHLLEATVNTTKYLASLGHNALMNNETGQFYVLYETVELRDAFEVSDALLYVVCTIAVTCAIIWAISEGCYPTVFNGSLYKLIYKETESKEKDTPMLMKFKNDPLAFDGYQVIPDLDEKPRAPSLEVPDTLVNIESMQQPLVQETPMQEIPMQHLSARQLPMESEIHIQSQSLTAKTCPTITVVAPVTNDTNDSADTTNFISLPAQTSFMPPSPPFHTTSHSIQCAPSIPNQ
jgi:hypothetical protein